MRTQSLVWGLSGLDADEVSDQYMLSLELTRERFTYS